MLALISTLIFGLVIGIIAKLLMPGRDPGGWIVTMVLGVVGALIGKWIHAAILGSGDITRWSIAGLFWGVIGAIILLFLYRLIVVRREHHVT